jgi:NitT/TauT family transport system substrate-binding protein
MVETRPEQVQALVNTWFDILQYIEENPDSAYEILAERAGVTLDEYRAYDAGTTIFTIEDNLAAFESGNDMTSLPYAAEEIADFLLASEFIDEKPDLQRLFDDQFVKAYAEANQS